VTSAYVNTSIAITGVDINTSSQVISTHLTSPLPSAQGGTASAFFAIAGPTALRTYTFPDASATILTTNAAVTIPQGGTGQTTATAAFNALAPATATGGIIVATGTNAYGNLAIGPLGTCLTSTGVTASWLACASGAITGSGSPVAAEVGVWSGSTVLTGYTGFTSDPNGNVNANSYTSGSGFTAGTIASVGDLLCFTANSTVGDCGTSATNFIGTADTASGTIFPHVIGVVVLNYDGVVSPSAGWHVCSSTTTGGQVHPQSAACSAFSQVGIVAIGGTNQTAGSVWLQFE
jgi:hypothetical protein